MTKQHAFKPTEAQNLYMLAVSHLKGILKEADSKLAIQYLEKASELGLCEAIYQLGGIYAEGYLEDKNIDRAFDYFSRASALGFVPAKFALATLYADVENYKQSFNLLEKLAKSGLTEAQTNLANLYLQGLGTRKDVNHATSLLKMAAEKGDRLAQYRLGELYYKGIDVVSNYLLARQYIVQAMEQNYLPAYLIMAAMLEHGYGISRDEIRAYCLYQFCHKYGVPNLSELMQDILNGLGPQDAERAKTLAEEYCNHEPIPV